MNIRKNWVSDMTKKMTNMESGADFEVYDIYDMARASGLTSYYIQRLVDDDTVETPAPAFKFGSKELWMPDAAEIFKKLAEEDKARDANLSFTKAALVEKAETMIKRFGNRHRERKIEYREDYYYTQGVYDFVNTLSDMGIPEDKAEELRTITRKLQYNAGLLGR